MIESIGELLRQFFAFKAYVMLPVIVLLIGLLARMGVKAALLAALKLGAGFAGVFVAFNFFVSRLQPAVKAIAALRGLDYPVIDIGWPPLAAITWAWPYAPLAILAIGALNLAMVATKTTKILYIDIWNYWHLALVGAILHATGAGILSASLAVLAIAVYNFKTSEWSALYVRRECGVAAVGLSPLSVAGLLPYAAALDRLMDRIPGFRKLVVDPSRAGKGRGSVLAEPMVIGFILGLFLGLLAGYPVKSVLETAVEIAAVMIILPRCGEAIGEAMGGVSGALRARIEGRLSAYSGLSIASDSGVVMGNRSVIATGLVLMPLSLGLAFVLPGNRLIPLGDLPNLISVLSLVTLVMRGNVLRSVIAGIPVVVSYLYIAGGLAPTYTRLAASTGMDFGAGGSPITAFTDGGNQVRWWFLGLFRGDLIALLLLPVVGLLLLVAWREQRRVRAEVEAGAEGAA